MRVADFAEFIIAREATRIRKAADKPKPWTDDPILQTFRFCNVRREDDAVSIWVREEWRERHMDDPLMWFAMVVARLFNNPDTLAAIGYPVPWKPAKVKAIINKRRAAGLKVFNAAYIVSTNGRPGDKVDYLFSLVLGPMWEKRKKLTAAINGRTLAEAHAALMDCQGMGSFMAAQIVADLKYTPALQGAQDWYSWAAPGPGSMRGLNRVRGMDPDTPWGRAWLPILLELREAVIPKLPKPLRNLHAQDLQNCLCEFDKYERIKTGEGRPKQLYNGKE